MVHISVMSIEIITQWLEDPSNGGRVFFRLSELCILNAMVVSFHKNPDKASNRWPYKYSREASAN